MSEKYFAPSEEQMKENDLQDISPAQWLAGNGEVTYKDAGEEKKEEFLYFFPSFEGANLRDITTALKKLWPDRDLNAVISSLLTRMCRSDSRNRVAVALRPSAVDPMRKKIAEAIKAAKADPNKRAKLEAFLAELE